MIYILLMRIRIQTHIMNLIYIYIVLMYIFRSSRLVKLLVVLSLGPLRLSIVKVLSLKKYYCISNYFCSS